MATTDRVGDWVRLVEDVYPPRDAEDWDAVGLQVGDPGDGVTAVLVCLDVTTETLAEAARVGANLVIAHHPLLFRPLANLTPDTATGLLALRAAREGVAVLAVHTNFDVAESGTTDPMVSLLNLSDVRPLKPRRPNTQGEVKVVTFVPQEHTGAVLAAMAAAGGGVIGEYDHCSFRVAGTGTFRPSLQAHPAVGERDTLNEVPEHRLEIVAPRAGVAAVVSALIDAHPYEEVAYDVYPLVEIDPGQSAKGLGRLGRLPSPQPLRALADRLAAGLPAPHLRVAGRLDRPVQLVAACGGAGDSLLPDAQRAGADVYVTGDLRHHPVLDALAVGMAVIDAGHYATEAAALPAFREALAAAGRRRGLRARLLPSTVRTEPWAEYVPPAGEGTDEAP